MPLPEPGAPAVTRADIDELLRFLPHFEQPWRAFTAEDAPLPTSAHASPAYTAEVLDFFQRAAKPCWRDTNYIPEQAAALLADDARLARATLAELRSVLTYCVRGERFSAGFWETLLTGGRIAAVLRRLAQLRERV